MKEIFNTNSLDKRYYSIYNKNNIEGINYVVRASDGNLIMEALVKITKVKQNYAFLENLTKESPLIIASEVKVDELCIWLNNNKDRVKNRLSKNERNI